MSNVNQNKRLRRKARIRARVSGTPERPRLTVFRSNKNLFAQVIDDTSAVSLAALSTQSKDLAERLAGKSKTESAKIVGEALAKLCASKGITAVVFDRNGYDYHGRVLALAEGAREGGLQF